MTEPFGYFRAEPFGWTDCAERGQAQMLGAGKITCQVVKKGGAE